MMNRFLKVSSLLFLGLATTAVMAQRPPRIVAYKMFDDQYRTGGYDYTYGGTGSKVTITKEGGFKSKSALDIALDPKDYSGASICLYNEFFNLKPFLLNSTLEFDIKGKVGGEQLLVGLLDEEVSDGKKTQVKLSMNKYGQVTNTWTHVKIPLADFPDRGLYWDQEKKTELPSRIDWDKIAEVRFSIDKGVNPSFEVFIDNIEIVKGNKSAAPKAKIVYWDENNEVLDGPKNPEKLDGKAKEFKAFYTDGIPGFSYVYGGLTAQKELNAKTAGNPNKNVLAMYIDNNDWSGVTYSLGDGKYIDLSSIRNKGGLYFWIKGKLGKEKLYVGLLDNQGNDVKSQTKLGLNDWIKVSTDWQLVKIPLKKFFDKGKAWDANKQAEVAKDMQWNKIQEIRFSVGKGENAGEPGKPAPVTVYVDQITFTSNIDWMDPDLKWDSFKSNAPDYVISDFDGKYAAEAWEGSKGPKSQLSQHTGKGRLDGNNLIVDHYLLADWVDVVLDMKKQNRSAKDRDWTKYWGLMFDVYSEKAWQSITVQIQDSGNEVYVSNTGVPKGRSTVLVPFRSFGKFPYYQPPDAIENGTLDLDKVIILDFKPSGEGTSGGFEIDNIRLTNKRELPKVEHPAIVKATINGNFNDIVNPKIADGIFGINAALWDGDLLKVKNAKTQSSEYVERVHHGIIRYPGGLRADDDHWKQILDNKDWMIDTDEFLDWLKKTGDNAMFTVNFGSGTAEEAAAWVKHTNIDKKAGIKYWEIGNEIYGNWHPYYEKYGKDGGTIYGKRAREFIVAMKKVDPTIKVAVVGVLEGDWNEKVLEQTADVADGIIVHHYPQHFGEENDFALLSAPQTLEPIFARLHKLTDKWKAKAGKKLEIWLTEWNSVDFNPGPQTLAVENGLFIADYLGELARLGADNAQYWDIHNDLTPEGGDYGYLTRSGEECMNCPRPSYWAFQMASDALRGKMVKTTIDGDNESLLTAYLTDNNGKKSLLIVNKSPYSDFDLKLNIPGFSGKASVQVLDKTTEKLKEGWANDPSKKAKTVDLSKGIKIGKRTLTFISVK
ncbi:MAG: carbohydrate-binding protein [Fibrobacteraceae bacterium]|nr:carbohydrate-binding protein [Fibrobacteraceae bacterium]